MFRAFNRIFRSRRGLSADAETAMLQSMAQALTMTGRAGEDSRSHPATFDLSTPSQRLVHLKRAGAYEEALALALALIDQIEQRAGASGRPSHVSWCYREAAAICRLLQRPEDEIVILERFRNTYAERLTSPSTLVQRLDRAKSATMPGNSAAGPHPI